MDHKIIEAAPMTANDTQQGGEHYRTKSIQPWDYIYANGLGYFEGNVVKYVTRWREHPKTAGDDEV